METVAMMTETQHYLEKIQAIAESALAGAASKSAPSSRKSSLTTIATGDQTQPFMSSNNDVQESSQEARVETQRQQAHREARPQNHHAAGNAQNQSQEHDSLAHPSTPEMADTKLSRFYHVMGSSESSAAERREQEERARREAEERARRANDGK
ncbi:uncharacterized protein PV09_09197 [Verruconis gallopava]|uniref:Uncharacterized protein n=1 Tax=Verruconis gallopava TaxID=253628 RepID=A0A0D1ZXC4_9PEZI|nr:uncharacterized protein PV09_09197 [Verruconis gallopava]KIV99097.1 hypothetical protein PV09_09197 [Verruconis gallopava]